MSCQAKQVQPNILLFFAYDLGWMDLGCYGSSFYDTPHLYQLAKNGVQPTILDACGLALLPEQHKDGVSLMPLLKGKKNLTRKAIYWHDPHYGGKGDSPCAAVRVGDWKLIEFFEDNRIELYNIRTDMAKKKQSFKKETTKSHATKKYVT